MSCFTSHPSACPSHRIAQTRHCETQQCCSSSSSKTPHTKHRKTASHHHLLQTGDACRAACGAPAALGGRRGGATIRTEHAAHARVEPRHSDNKTVSSQPREFCADATLITLYDDVPPTTQTHTHTLSNVHTKPQTHRGRHTHTQSRVCI